MLLKDKVAVITGASAGIGRSIALGYAGEGASVVLVGRGKEALEKVLGEVQALGAEGMIAQADAGQRAEVMAAVAAVVEKWGKVDILVNCAGFTKPAMLHKMSEEVWDSVINAHLKGTFNFIQAVLPSMMERKSGRIINVTSAAGLVGTIGQANYAAAKGGIIALTKSAAKELARHNITVNAIAPAAATRMTEVVRTDPKLAELSLERIALRRWAEPEEIVPVFVLLAGPGGSYVTGQIWNVDGGVVI